MKKIITALIVFLLSINTVIAEINTPLPLPDAETTIADFTSENQFKPDKGDFRTEKTPYEAVLDKNFDDGNSDSLTPDGGSFKIIDGKYVQQSQDTIVSKSMTSSLTENFVIEFDATALSSATTIVVFLGYTENGYYTFEYSYNGAVLRKNGTEDIITAASDLKKDEQIHFKITTENNIFRVFVNNEAEPFIQTDSEKNFSGKAGFGTWASSVAFDNIKVSVLTPGIGEYRLISESNDESVVYSSESFENSRISSNIKASSFLNTEIGLILRSEYYFVCDGEFAYIKKNTANGMKTLAVVPYRILSNEYYLYSATATGEKLTFSINNVNLVSVFDSDYKTGFCGIYKKGSPAVINDIYTDIVTTEIAASDENEEHLAAYKILSELGIMSHDENRIPAPITRLEFAEAVSKMLKLPTASAAEFADTDSIYAKAICEAGLMSLIDENYFGADKKISRTDASKVLTDAIGKKNEANLAGGYPNGYMMTAAKYELTKSITNEFITFSDASVMIKRALECDRYKDEILNPRGISIFEELYSIKTASGIFETDITNTSLSENEASASGIVFDYSDKALSGRFVKCYYRENKNNEPSTLVCVYKTKSEELAIDIKDVQLPFTSASISYYNKEKLNSLNISAKTKIIYNNEYLCTADNVLMNIIPPLLNDGNITAVFNKGKKEADYLFINNYRTVLVKRINTQENKIFDLFSSDPVDLSNPDDVLKNEDGTIAEIASVKQYDVVYASVPLNNNSKTSAILSPGKSVEGVIKTQDEDTITLGTDVYKKNKATFPAFAKVGEKVTVYFDSSYTAVYAELENKSEYGYLIKSIYSEDGSEPSLLLSLYSINNGAAKLNVSEKATFCDYSVSTSPAKIKRLKALYDSISAYQGLIRYETNNEGIITKLYLPRDLSGNTPQNNDVFTMNFYKDSCQHIYNNFYSRYIVTPETKVLVVPSDASQSDKYYLKPYGSLKNDESYRVALYDCDEKYRISVAVIYKEPTIFDSNTCVIKQIGSAVNEDGESLIAIHIFEKGQEKIIYAKENLQCDPVGGVNFGTTHLYLSDLNPGDVLSYHLDTEGYLRDYLVAFEKEKEQDYYRTAIYGWWTENIPHSPLAIGYAKTTRVLNDRFFINMYWGTVSCLPSGSVMYVVYDEKSTKNRIRLGTLEDLDETDDVLCLWNYSTLNNVMIIKKD